MDILGDKLKITRNIKSDSNNSIRETYTVIAPGHWSAIYKFSIITEPFFNHDRMRILIQIKGTSLENFVVLFKDN